MTTTETMATAGLIFQGLRDLDIVKIGNRVSNAFEMLEQPVTGVRILSNNRACISSTHHNVTVRVLEDHVVDGLTDPAPMMLELAVEGDSALNKEIPHKDTVLAHALKSLHWTLSADQVKWVTPGAVLSSADFVMATSQNDQPEAPVQPRVTLNGNSAGIVERRYILPSIDETNDQLQQRLSQKAVQKVEDDRQRGIRTAFALDPDNYIPPDEVDEDDIREKTAPLRLSVWMVSFTVALFALPVGAALLVFNLLKGENLRLSSQVAALTGTFISLEAYGATAEAMSVLQTLVH